MKHVPAEAKVEAPPTRVAPRPIPRPPAPMAVAGKSKAPRPAKSGNLTPELRDRIIQMFHESEGMASRELHADIANKLWLKRQVVADVIRDLVQTKVGLSDEQRDRAIEMYKRFVETGHRPEGGRRRAISVAVGVPYKQVMRLIREWSMAEYQMSPTPTPSRQQLFEVEKMYWDELSRKRYRLTELPDRIAEQLGYVTRWQVLRWLDVLHDDERSFDNVSDPEPEVQEQILELYRNYLSSAAPPEQGLHYSIADQISKVSPRQVHKILQAYRHKKRSEYPLL